LKSEYWLERQAPVGDKKLLEGTVTAEEQKCSEGMVIAKEQKHYLENTTIIKKSKSVCSI